MTPYREIHPPRRRVGSRSSFALRLRRMFFYPFGRAHVRLTDEHITLGYSYAGSLAEECTVLREIYDELLATLESCESRRVGLDIQLTCGPGCGVDRSVFFPPEFTPLLVAEMKSALVREKGCRK